MPVPDAALAQANAHSGAVFGDPEAQTEEMDAYDLALLEKWASRHQAFSASALSQNNDDAKRDLALPVTDPAIDLGLIPPAANASAVRIEAGLRICPNCKKPVHLGADACRACGTRVPRQ